MRLARDCSASSDRWNAASLAAPAAFMRLTSAAKSVIRGAGFIGTEWRILRECKSMASSAPQHGQVTISVPGSSPGIATSSYPSNGLGDSR